MRLENFIKAMSIIAENHSAEVVINHVDANGQVPQDMATNPRLHIVNCTGATVNKLKDAGFSLSMHNGKMTVDDYAMRS